MTRRLEDRIRNLCGRVIAAHDSDQLRAILSELESALHEHTERLRKTAGAKLVSLKDNSPPERRSF